MEAGHRSTLSYVRDWLGRARDDDIWFLQLYSA